MTDTGPVRWLTAFIDLPDDRFEAGAAFWAEVLNAPMGPTRDTGMFATLEPVAGDSCARVQRTSDGPRIHLDLHVEADGQADELKQKALDAGATLLAEPGFPILASPAGLRFCLVDHHGEAERPAPNPTPQPHTLHLVCIDVPADSFETEYRFWATLFGLGSQPGDPGEFARVHVAPHMPFGILIQRLSADDDATEARAHLDMSCGPNVAEVAAAHVKLGATVVTELDDWTVMHDPTGQEYCLVNGSVEAPNWAKFALQN